MAGGVTHKRDLDKAGSGCGNHDVDFRIDEKGIVAQMGIDVLLMPGQRLQSCLR